MFPSSMIFPQNKCQGMRNLISCLEQQKLKIQVEEEKIHLGATISCRICKAGVVRMWANLIIFSDLDSNFTCSRLNNAPPPNSCLPDTSECDLLWKFGLCK